MEKDGGFASGTGGGKGPATAAFTSACEGLRGLREALASQIADADAKTNELSEKLVQLRFTIDDPTIGLLDREQALRKALAELEMLVRRFRNTGLQKTVESGVAALGNAVSPVDKSSGFPSGTIAAINGLSSKLRSAAADLEVIRAGGVKASNYQPPERRSLNAITADYVTEYPSVLLMAIMVDVWPWWTIIIVLLIGVGTPKPHQFLGKRKARRLADTLELEPVTDDLMRQLTGQSNADQ
jgi:hypothetical protein